MNTTDKLKYILSTCKCSVTINLTQNYHKDCYLSISDYMQDKIDRLELKEDDIPSDILAKMIETDNFIEIQFYPDSPVGSYQVYHYDIDLALDEVIRILESK